MTVVAWIFAVLAGVFHLAAFVMESILFDRPAVQRRFGVDAGSAAGVGPWAFNQGFYNLALAAGALVGVITWAADHETAGQTLIVFSCAAMVLAGIVLFVSQRRLWRAAAGQALPPAIAIVATLAS
jgi:putative membrane protein